MKTIICNQIGYRPQDRKCFVFRGTPDQEYRVVCTDSQEVVWKGNLSEEKYNLNAGEKNCQGDFSDLQQPGRYEVQIGNEVSYPFLIGEDVYTSVTKDLCRMFYLQRCGTELTEELAGEFAHKKCHDSIAHVYNDGATDKTMDVSGGWHDAGDYGRYIVAAAVAVADLLLAYKKKPQIFAGSLSIPESGNNVPDILNEVRYELEWMLKMQNTETGAVYHKVTCYGFPGFVMPEEETEPLLVFAESVTATATFAAAMAMSVDFYKNLDGEFAEKCLEASREAYRALKGWNMPGGFKNPEGVITGEYGDGCDTDERYWASAQLYAATGEAQYREDFEKIAREKIYMGYGWEDVGSFGNDAYLSCKYPKDDKIVQAIDEQMRKSAEKIYENVMQDGYNSSIGEEYIWGSNMVAANNGIHLYQAYEATKEEKYLDAAKEQVHYLFGKNPMGICYVTGHGTKSPINPHHRPSAALKKPMPGMLVGGPDAGIHDEIASEYLRGLPKAKCYIDHLDSYSTNEITIYWNAPLILLLALI